MEGSYAGRTVFRDKNGERVASVRQARGLCSTIGSASDSSSEGWEFESLRGHFALVFLFNFFTQYKQ